MYGATMTLRKMAEGGDVGASLMLRIDDRCVRAELDGSAPARALVARLPLRLSACGTGIALSARLPFELPLDRAAISCGWRDGDISYDPCGGWLSLFTDDEENSGRYGDRCALGRVTGTLDSLRGMVGAFDMRLELIEDGRSAHE